MRAHRPRCRSGGDYLEQTLGYSAVKTGVAFLPGAIASNAPGMQDRYIGLILAGLRPGHEPLSGEPPTVEFLVQAASDKGRAAGAPSHGSPELFTHREFSDVGMCNAALHSRTHQ